MLPPRPFVLPGVFGWVANLIGVSYVIVTTVLFLFPPDLPVTGSNMSTFSIIPLSKSSPDNPQWLICTDYCIVAFTIVLIISTVQWFVDGRKNFKGPRMDLDVLQRGVSAADGAKGGDGEVHRIGAKVD